MTLDTCLAEAIQQAEDRLDQLPEDVKEALISYSNALCSTEENR